MAPSLGRSLIAAELVKRLAVLVEEELRERLVVLIEEENRKVIDWVTADHNKLIDLVEWNSERYNRLIAKVH